MSSLRTWLTHKRCAHVYNALQQERGACRECDVVALNSCGMRACDLLIACALQAEKHAAASYDKLKSARCTCSLLAPQA
eukprot:1790477-Amphidinium_carterae.2